MLVRPTEARIVWIGTQSIRYASTVELRLANTTESYLGLSPSLFVLAQSTVVS